MQVVEVQNYRRTKGMINTAVHFSKSTCHNGQLTAQMNQKATVIIPPYATQQTNNDSTYSNDYALIEETRIYMQQ